MKYLAILVILVASMVGGGCSGDKSKELFETAQFEEKQSNREHAEKLYAEIVAKYPDSPLAKQAQQRLAVLRGKQ